MKDLYQVVLLTGQHDPIWRSQDETSSYHQLQGSTMSTPRRILVVGGVAAGMSAASQARRRQGDAEVVVFERGHHISYGACGMPYNIEDPEREMDDLVVLTPERARSDRGIELYLRHQVEGIDLKAGTVTVTDLETDVSRSERFDALVLATGASAAAPPIPGLQLNGVSVLRELEDGRRIKGWLAEGCRRAVIVGGGYIGLEMAHVLSARGVGVTLLERLPQILPGWHENTVKTVLETLEEHSVEYHTGVTVQALEGDSDGHIRAVAAGDTRWDADLVLVATGVRPEARLAREAGLRIGDSGAIWVNQNQRTSHEAAWAAGDCAEAYHRVLRRNVWIPLGTTANKQGRVAGANATGLNQRFGGIVGTAGFVVFDLEVARTGLGPQEAADEGFDPIAVTIRQRSRAHGYPGGAPVQVTLVADGPSGILLGGEITGREGAALRVNTLATAVAGHQTVADLQSQDLVYAPPFAPVWDPLLVAANQLAKKVGRKT